MTTSIKEGSTVVDRWWPYRSGKVVKKFKTTLHVKWFEGTTWIYDKAHIKFLQEI